MYLQKVIMRKNFWKNLFFVGLLKVSDENSRIRIRIRIRIHYSDIDPRIQIRIRIHSKISWIGTTASLDLIVRIGWCWRTRTTVCTSWRTTLSWRSPSAAPFSPSPSSTLPGSASPRSSQPQPGSGTFLTFLCLFYSKNIDSASVADPNPLDPYVLGLVDPDPLVRGMDPRIQIRIHTKMSWIRNLDSTIPVGGTS